MGTDLQTQRQKAAVPVAQQLSRLHTALKQNADKIFHGLPAHVNRDRVIVSAIRAVRENPDLAKCTPESFCQSVARAAFMGWEIGGLLGQCYLIPFKDRERGMEAQLVPGYRGLIDLCRRSGQIGTITHRLVHKGDHFSYVMGDEERIEHTPSSADDRLKQPVTHVYVIVEMKNGGRQREVWTAAEINHHRDKYAKGANRSDSPWQQHWGTMAYKTIVRDMVMRGKLPMSAELRDAQEAFRREDVVEASSWIEEVAGDGPPQDQLETPALDEAQRIENARLEIIKCETVDAVNAASVAAQEGMSDEGQFRVEEYAESRRQVIRAVRGQGSRK